MEGNNINKSCPESGKPGLEHEDSWKLDFVQKKIRETGFQLEDKVWSVFADKLKGCDIEPTYYFSDWETSEARELDFRISYQVTELPIMVEYVFLIECKQLPDNYWVFVKSRQRRMAFKNAISIWDNIGRMGRQTNLVKILHPIFKSDDFVCDSYSHRYKELRSGQNKLNKGAKTNRREDNIRSSEIKLAKAFYFEKRNALRLNNVERYRREQYDYVRILYPMIVFEGNLLEADMLVDPPLVRFISSCHLFHFSIQNKKSIYMVIDVVGADNLATFIQNKILPEMEQLNQQWAKFKDSYMAQIGDILACQSRN